MDGVWVFGMVERGSGELRLEVCPENRRDQSTLLQLIQKNVEPGTTVMSDCWKGYNNLSSNGYVHLTVNHSKHFVDPATHAHTQQIESGWRALKRRLSRGGIRQDSLGLHFAEYLWMKKNNSKTFDKIIIAIRNYA